MSTQTEARAGIAVANAPVSYGAFEITVGHDPNVPDGISVLDQVAAAGYAGIDLGPVGYLGSGTRLGELLAPVPDPLVVFEMPGGLTLAPEGWTCLRRLGQGARQPTVCFFTLNRARP